MGFKIVSRTVPAIDLPTLRRHLKLDPVEGPHEDDDYVLSLLDAAVEHAEHYTQRAVGGQVVELALDAFPAGAIELVRGPVTEVLSVIYVDDQGVSRAVSPNAYALDNYGEQHWLLPAFGGAWPKTQASANAVLVRYAAGLLAGATRAALLLIVGGLYANRESVTDKPFYSLPLGVKSLLDAQKVWALA